MINHSFINRLQILKKNGVNLHCVLDIGAYHGDFTETIKSVYPFIKVIQIEADDRQKKYLQEDAIIALLGDSDRDVTFYTLAEDQITTGSSIFLELTPYYNDRTVITQQKQMTTLDILDKQFNFVGDWANHGLVKIDTQGSELLILDGAHNFLTNKCPRFILLEVSVQEYNKDAPKFNLVSEYMNKLNYTVKDIYDLSYDSMGQLLQMDILFERQPL